VEAKKLKKEGEKSQTKGKESENTETCRHLSQNMSEERAGSRRSPLFLLSPNGQAGRISARRCSPLRWPEWLFFRAGLSMQPGAAHGRRREDADMLGWVGKQKRARSAF